MEALELVAAACALVSAGLGLTAGVGLVRFPDTLSRMHAAAKPQVLGVLLALAAAWCEEPSWGIAGPLLLVAIFQMVGVTMTSYTVGHVACEEMRDR
ncbi:monovalent cation/H(+) antiporter subunit G [Nonomuraea sp. NPDC050310]|uniref:cation:proton antiporter n=1 Tax=unclassified Nonomuraea TaxID=2593643 RepID=UPI0033D79E48